MRTSRPLAAFLVLGVIASMAGCATVPSPAKMQTETAEYRLPGIPDPGNAMVYVVRPSFLGTVIRFNVFVDTQEPASEMGYTRGGEYIYFQVAPGDHTIYSKAENWAETVVSLKAGEIAFLSQDPTMGFLMARNSLLRIDDVVGKYYVKTLAQGTILQTASAATRNPSRDVDAAFASKIESAFSSAPTRAATASPDVRPDSAPKPRQVPGDLVAGASGPQPATISTLSVRAGDRWEYRLTSGQRSVGLLVIEAREVRAGMVSERATFDIAKSFVADRDMSTATDVRRFEDSVALPGGYLLAEMAPYLSTGLEFVPGQTWSRLSAQLALPYIGRRTFLFEARVVGLETVHVPMGSYKAWRIDAVAQEEQYEGTPLKVSCSFWYVSGMPRVVRTTLKIDSGSIPANADDTYALAGFQRNP